MEGSSTRRRIADPGNGNVAGRLEGRPARMGRRPPPWRDVRILRALFQAAILAFAFFLYWYFAGNLLTNLNRQGIRTDFGFLDEPAGFAIADSDFRSADPVRTALLVGLRNTVVVALTGIVLATVVGVLTGVARLSRNFLVRKGASLYVETLRNVPLVAVIIFFYTAVVLKLPPLGRQQSRTAVVMLSNSGAIVPTFERTGNATALVLAAVASLAAGIAVAWLRTRRSEKTGEPHHRVLWGAAIAVGGTALAYVVLGAPLALELPQRDGFVVRGGLRLSAEFAALLIALVIYTASHIAEIVRGSILAVSRGQSEAALALGLTDFQRLRFVVLPQAFRIMVPPLANQFLNLTKNSSLAVFIAYPEVTRVTRIVIAQGNPAPQSIAVLMFVYLMLSLSISLVMNIVNRRLRLEGR